MLDWPRGATEDTRSWAAARRLDEPYTTIALTKDGEEAGELLVVLFLGEC